MPAPREDVPSTSETLTEVCPPSEPFITKETSDKPPADWEQLREALIPPPNLFTPPPKPTSPLLATPPQFFETPEPVPAPPSRPDEKAVIPDTISIPATPAWPSQLKPNPLLGSPPPQIFPNQN
ncbi:hypothetical protein [Prosthecobacter debontii]|nr:hypothetical protein [Prosthecobacter debontii]